MALRRIAGPVLAAMALLALAARAEAQPGKPLSEDALSALISQQVPDDFVIKKIEKTGVGFPVDAAAMKRLKDAGASDAVLAALQQAGQPANAVTYQGILQLLRRGANEAEILKQLKASPTTLVLDDEQMAALRKAGASDRVLDAVQSNRNPIGTGSDINNFAVVLDCSGSMTDKTPDGVSKMDAAKKVVTKFIRELKNDKRLAFIVYGTEPTKYKCQDVHVVQPLAPLTDAMKDKLAEYIDSLEPAGWTPLALGMQTAGLELAKGKGLCQLIVVTDGMETCHGNPGDVAEDLTKNLNLPGGVDVIGFGVEPDEKAALFALEKKGKFNLYKSDTGGEDLIKKLHEAEERGRQAAKALADKAGAAEAAAAKQRADEEAERLAAKQKAEEEARRLALKHKEEDKTNLEEAAEKDDFPYPEQIKWDAKAFEDLPDDTTFVKRKVDKEKVTWVLKPKSKMAVDSFNIRLGAFRSGDFNKSGFYASFRDEDGVEIALVKLDRTPAPANSVKEGDPVRMILPLPAEDTMKKTKKVVVVWQK